jgi:hypothetical protein
MELEDYETIHLARELAREKGWEHVITAIRAALREEVERVVRAGNEEPAARTG